MKVTDQARALNQTDRAGQRSQDTQDRKTSAATDHHQQRHTEEYKLQRLHPPAETKRRIPTNQQGWNQQAKIASKSQHDRHGRDEPQQAE